MSILCISLQIKPFSVAEDGLDLRVELASGAKTFAIGVQNQKEMNDV